MKPAEFKQWFTGLLVGLGAEAPIPTPAIWIKVKEQVASLEVETKSTPQVLNRD